MTGARSDLPAPLAVAASLVAVEGIVLVLLSIVEIANLSGGRLTMGITTSVFFLGYGVALVLCGVLLGRAVSWGRGPAVLAQLIQLGLAWSFHGDPTTWIAIALAVVALITLAGIFHPASLDALAAEE